MVVVFLFSCGKGSQQAATGTKNGRGVDMAIDLTSGAEQGLHGAGTIGYRGPCPPSGTHRYIFEIYALDTKLDLGGGATAQRLSDAMDGHILAEGRLMGTYRRR